MQRRSQAIIFAVILAVAFSAEAAVLYFGTDRALRLGVGLLMLGPILLAASRLGVVEHAVELLNQRVGVRQFGRLRALVRQLLWEIRRLNWTAVDAERGSRDREELIKEMNATEDRLKELIGQIRSAAGQETSEGEETQGGED